MNLNRKLRQLKKDASEVQRKLTLMCRSDLDSILITILKDNPPLNAETSNLLDKLAAKTSSSVLNQEISRILGPQNPDILSALRVRPLA